MEVKLFEKLSDPRAEDFQETWRKFFYDVRQVQQVLAEASSPAAMKDLINSGLQWTGGGWTTTSASRRLYELTGVALVSHEFADYLGGFLFSLALATGVEIPSVHLESKAADAAFALAGLWSKEPEEAMNVDHQVGLQPEVQAAEVFSWDEWEEPLPPRLAQLWQRAKDGTHRVDMKTLLDSVPQFAGLP